MKRINTRYYKKRLVAIAVAENIIFKWLCIFILSFLLISFFYAIHASAANSLSRAAEAIKAAYIKEGCNLNPKNATNPDVTKNMTPKCQQLAKELADEATYSDWSDYASYASAGAGIISQMFLQKPGQSGSLKTAASVETIGAGGLAASGAVDAYLSTNTFLDQQAELKNIQAQQLQAQQALEAQMKTAADANTKKQLQQQLNDLQTKQNLLQAAYNKTHDAAMNHALYGGGKLLGAVVLKMTANQAEDQAKLLDEQANQPAPPVLGGVVTLSGSGSSAFTPPASTTTTVDTSKTTTGTTSTTTGGITTTTASTTNPNNTSSASMMPASAVATKKPTALQAKASLATDSTNKGNATNLQQTNDAPPALSGYEGGNAGSKAYYNGGNDEPGIFSGMADLLKNANEQIDQNANAENQNRVIASTDAPDNTAINSEEKNLFSIMNARYAQIQAKGNL